MSRQFQQYWKRVTLWYLALASREKVIVCVAGICLVVAGIYQMGVSLDDYIKTNHRKVTVRRAQLDEIDKILKRYVTLKSRQDNLQKTFAQSEMSFEQVTAQLDRIVREAMGNDNYDLKKSRTPTAFGFEYEKQEFTLNIKSLAIDQLVKLLHRLEQGERPLFLSKIDIVRSAVSGDYSATLEIFSIAKSQANSSATST